MTFVSFPSRGAGCDVSSAFVSLRRAVLCARAHTPAEEPRMVDEPRVRYVNRLVGRCRP